MRRARLTRDESGDHGTLGTLEAGPLRLFTMEPPWRGNARNVSCIPPGEYAAAPHRSPRFGRCLLVTGVPGRTHILFHAGNLGGDRSAGWLSHTMGCVLPGERSGRLRAGGRVQRAVLASRTAQRRLLAWAGDDPFLLEVIG